MWMLFLLIDLGLTIPAKGDIARENEGQMRRLSSNNKLQQEDMTRKTERQTNNGLQQDYSRSRQSDFILDLLINITEQEGMERELNEDNDTAARLKLSTMIEDLGKVVEKKQRKSRRSSDGWTCSDLAFIVREYNYVIDILEKINYLIRERFLETLEDELDDVVREFVTETLGMYTHLI